MPRFILSEVLDFLFLEFGVTACISLMFLLFSPWVFLLLVNCNADKAVVNQAEVTASVYISTDIHQDISTTIGGNTSNI